MQQTVKLDVIALEIFTLVGNFFVRFIKINSNLGFQKIYFASYCLWLTRNVYSILHEDIMYLFDNFLYFIK